MPEYSQAGIVSRITRKVASEADRRRVLRTGRRSHGKLPKNMAFRRQIPTIL
jgi:hypothetical protein